MPTTNSTTTRHAMHRDPLAQYQQADPRFVESLDSVARAQDYQRRERAKILELAMAVGDLAWFDRDFVAFYKQDRAIVIFISDAAAQRGLSLIPTLEVQ